MARPRRLSFEGINALCRDRVPDRIFHIDAITEFEAIASGHKAYDVTPDGYGWIRAISYDKVRKCEENMPWHVHDDDCELICCRQGACEYECRGERFRMTPGSVFFTKPHEPHRQASSPIGFSCYILRIGIRPANAYTQNGFSAAERKWFLAKLQTFPRIFSAGSDVLSRFHETITLIERLRSGSPERRFLLRGAIFGLLNALISAAECPRNAEVGDRVNDLIRAMAAHPERAYPVDELASAAYMSRTALLTAFKAAVGFSPHAWLMKCRLECTKSRLRAGEGIADIAHNLGFCSAQHLIALFKRETGETPGTWLKSQVRGRKRG